VTDRPRIVDDDGVRDPRWNLAVDEALAREAGPEPVVRLWRDDPCVVVGRFQLVAAEVDLHEAGRLRVPVYRRFTGGGAVYHDPGNLNVSVVAPRSSFLRGTDALAGIYAAVLEPLASAVRRLGIPAEPDRRGLFVGSDKLGGVAAWVGARNVLVHATLLVDADLVALERVLAGPGAPADGRWRLTRSERVPVTSIARWLGGRVERAELDRVLDESVGQALAATWPAADGGRPRRDRLRPGELAAAAMLLSTRYADPTWHASGALAERR
jgi:lipoate---protein ligase